MDGHYIGGKKRVTKKRVTRKGGAVKKPIPRQLLAWHDFLEEFKKRPENKYVPYGELLQLASAEYQAEKTGLLKSEGMGARRRVTKPRVKRGAGIFDTIGRVSSLLGDVTGLGKKRVVKKKPSAKKPAAKRTRKTGSGYRVAGMSGHTIAGRKKPAAKKPASKRGVRRGRGLVDALAEMMI